MSTGAAEVQAGSDKKGIVNMRNIKIDKNADIKGEIEAAGLPYWLVAEKYGIADSTFSRKLRHEFSPEEKEKVRLAIATLKREK